MNVIPFAEGTCGKIRRHLDSYISNELLVETAHEVAQHIESCQECSDDLETRLRVRRMLQHAVRAEMAPADLRAKVQRTLRGGGATAHPVQWMLVAAAAVVICVGGAIALRTGSTHEVPREAQERVIASLYSKISGVFRVGLGDHVHCAIYREYPKDAPTASEMAESLGPEYAGLAAIVQQNVPPSFHAILGHKCHYHGREYVHIVLKNGSELVSVILTKRENGESFTSTNVAPVLQGAGTSVYQAHAQSYQVAGFETAQHLVFVVSEENARKNLELMAQVGPALAEWLKKLEG